jgi:hypothetical protein
MQGPVLTARSLDNSFLEILEERCETSQQMFPAHIKSKEDLRMKCQGSRSFRRTSDTQAIQMKVHQTDINVVNRWKTVEKVNGARPSRPMRQHHANFPC